NGKEWSDGGWKRAGGKTKIAFAVRGVLFQILHDAGGGANRVPVNAGIVGHQDERIDGLRGGDDLSEQVGATGVVAICNHGGTDVSGKAFALREAVIFAKE